ncbi:hypothetical protein SAMN05444920_112210 [Nonomuraea solani]|uniref:Ig-like domain-containing protein n=1 Tax=Nonomuraea solani TaxID=1144553 RepID=A0A1H6EQU5_9ACTN|nr:hypothetical protein [Nonomuraea solani]SEG99084.1 hypothetical protein SAMN05444920_112210 [Nonomuraea solani]
MMSVGLVRKVCAFGASAAVLSALAAGLVASPAQAATAGPKVAVSAPKASPGDFEGSCPAKVNFASTIKVPVKGKTELAYRWLHGDGSKSKVKVIKLTGKGTKSVTVRQSITFKEDVKGWEAIQVLGPKKVTSKKGYFSVSCEKPRQDNVRTHLDVSVSASAWASPSRYVGPCTPGDKIDFVGLIKADRPTSVRYRWVLNGEVVDYGRVRVHEARKVGFGISPRHSQRGWAQLQVLSPDGAYSNRAYYKVSCRDEAPDTRVSASASVSTTSDCKVNASGSIDSTGPGRVRWTWLVNGKPVSSGDTYFGHHGGSKSVDSISSALTGDATKGGTVTLSVSGPDNSVSVSKVYSACSAPAPAPGATTAPPTTQPSVPARPNA